jgi:hypothetical protein
MTARISLISGKHALIKGVNESKMSRRSGSPPWLGYDVVKGCSKSAIGDS